MFHLLVLLIFWPPWYYDILTRILGFSLPNPYLWVHPAHFALLLAQKT